MIIPLATSILLLALVDASQMTFKKDGNRIHVNIMQSLAMSSGYLRIDIINKNIRYEAVSMYD